jgi:microcystin-dependent protein
VTYSALFDAIGYTYGGSGTSFVIPDCRGRATYGQDNMGGSAAGRITTGGNFDGTVLGNSGGSQDHTLITAECRFITTRQARLTQATLTAGQAQTT